mgnify:CR=1 FL=1
MKPNFQPVVANRKLQVEPYEQTAYRLIATGLDRVPSSVETGAALVAADEYPSERFSERPKLATSTSATIS